MTLRTCAGNDVAVKSYLGMSKNVRILIFSLVHPFFNKNSDHSIHYRLDYKFSTDEFYIIFNLCTLYLYFDSFHCNFFSFNDPACTRKLNFV